VCHNNCYYNIIRHSIILSFLFKFDLRSRFWFYPQILPNFIQLPSLSFFFPKSSHFSLLFGQQAHVAPDPILLEFAQRVGYHTVTLLSADLFDWLFLFHFSLVFVRSICLWFDSLFLFDMFPHSFATLHVPPEKSVFWHVLFVRFQFVVPEGLFGVLLCGFCLFF